MRAGIRLIAICLILMLGAGAAWGTAVERPRGNALQFGMYGLMEFNTFRGYTVAFQNQLSRDLVLRSSMTLSLDFDSIDNTIQDIDELSLWGEAELKEWNHSARLFCELIRFRGEGIALYYGGGPYACYQDRQWEDFDVGYNYDYEETYRHSTTASRTLELGVTAVLGVQWAALDWLALHLEYRSQVGYTKEKHDSRREYVDPAGDSLQEETRISDGFRLYADGVKTGVSIYF